MTAIDLLNRVLELFKGHKDNSEILNYLLKDDLIHPTFEQRYISNLDDFDFILTDEIQKNENLMEFHLSASDRYPYKAEVIFDGKWYLKSFLFLCQGCFGDGEDCGVCGGCGWGVL